MLISHFFYFPIFLAFQLIDLNFLDNEKVENVKVAKVSFMATAR